MDDFASVIKEGDIVAIESKGPVIVKCPDLWKVKIIGNGGAEAICVRIDEFGSETGRPMMASVRWLRKSDEV